MFSFCDKALNPKSESDRIDLKIKDVLGNTIINKEMIKKFVKYLESINATNISKVENILDLNLYEFTELFNKNNKNIPHADLAFPNLDKHYKLKK